MGKSDEELTVPSRRQASRVARMIGCVGAHQHDDGTWMPCATHDELTALTGDSKAAKRRKRRGYGAPIPRRFQLLIERGVRGIDSMPGGGLVSAPVAGKQVALAVRQGGVPNDDTQRRLMRRIMQHLLHVPTPDK